MGAWREHCSSSSTARLEICGRLNLQAGYQLLPKKQTEKRDSNLLLNFFSIYVTLFVVTVKVKPGTYFSVQKLSEKTKMDPEQHDLKNENGF